MIQRIQSIYLTLAAICLGLMFAFNFAVFETADEEWVYNVMGLSFGDGVYQNFMSVPFYVVVPLMCVYTLITIFLYKNRKRQLFFIRVNYLLHISMLALLHISVYRIPGAFEAIVGTTFGVSVFLPAASFAFLYMASRGVKKDEALVRSLDRLR